MRLNGAILCPNGFAPESYILKMVSLLIGCLVIAFGAYFEVLADVTMLPADGFSRFLCFLKSGFCTKDH